MLRLRLLLFVLALSAIVFAQSSDTTSVSGIVKDMTGAVVPGVEVIATNTESSATRATTTDETGSYSFAQLKPAPTVSKRLTLDSRQSPTMLNCS